MSDLPEIEHTRNNALLFFQSFTKKYQSELANKIVVDVSAGRGYIAHLFEKAGSVVKPFDLFPEQNKYASSACQKIDLQQDFPIETSSSDWVICSETIEHLPDQHFLFQEVSRILKPGGIFILTTPNSSSLRSRFSQFLMESEHYSNPAPNELNATVTWQDGKSAYFNKIFISGVLRLRTLAALNKLELVKIHPTPYSSTSVFLLLFYPILYFFSWRAYRRQVRQDGKNKIVYKSIFQISTSRDVLLSKHLIVEFRRS